MRRANGYSNATWVGDGIAVRVAHTPVDMAREAALVRAPPREVGHPEILGDATAAAGRADIALGLSSAQQLRLLKIIEGYFQAAPLVAQRVNHGDLALMNALWDGEVIALLDFEFAVLGPVEIDLCRLVCEARVSEEGQQVDSEAGAAALEIAARHMDPMHGRALIHGAAALDQLRDLDIWLGHGSTEGRVEDRRPCRLLTDLLDAEGGYLAPLLR